jgi:hypothetical protein
MVFITKLGPQVSLSPVPFFGVNIIFSARTYLVHLSPSVLCGHPRHHDTIPGTASPSPTLCGYGTTRHRHANCCAPYGLPSAAPSSQRMDDDSTEDLNTTTLEAAPGWTQGTP